jgi:hypothetical protein
MRRTSTLWCAFVALLAGAGCSQEELLQKIASEEDQKVARECIDTFRKGDLAEIEARLDPSLKGADTHAALAQMAAMLPPGKPDAVKLVGANLNTNNDTRSMNLTYQYTWGQQYFLINCGTRTQGEQRVIFGLNVNQLDGSVEQQGTFDLKGKSPFQYAVLLAGVVFLVLSLVALFRCIMEKDLRRKWLWIIFIQFGIGQLSVNWNSGAWEFSAVHFLLFSASAVSPGYGPWVVSVALPVGATWYLVRRFLNHRAAARSNGG